MKLSTLSAYLSVTLTIGFCDATSQQQRRFPAFSGKYRNNAAFRKVQRKNEIYRKICKAVDCSNIQKRVPDLDIQTIKVPTHEIETVLPRVQAGDVPLFSEPLLTTNDSSCMQFHFPDAFLNDNFIISRADVLVYVKLNKKAIRRKRKKKIVIKVSTLDTKKDKRKVVTRLKFRPKRPTHYRVALPISVLRKLRRKKERKLAVCIQCKKCNRKVDIALLRGNTRNLRKRSKKKKNRKMQNDSPANRSLSKDRPILVYRIISKQRSKRDIVRYDDGNSVSNQCNGNSSASTCCTSQSYISFRRMGLHRYILYPNGFNFSQCIGSCSSHNPNVNDTLTDNQTSCQASNFEPLQIFVVFRKDVGFITLRKGIVHRCECS